MSEVDLNQRLKRLERDNRRLKAFVSGVIVLAAALGGIHAAKPDPQKITAREFDVVDNNGRVAVKLFAGWSDAGLEMFDQHGRKRAEFTTIPIGWSFIQLHDEQGMAEVSIMGRQPQEGLAKGTHPLPPEITLNGDGSHIALNGKGGRESVFLQAHPASIEIADSNGYIMDLGSTDTEAPLTGATQKPSAASIMMFGNDSQHHVIWRAP